MSATLSACGESQGIETHAETMQEESEHAAYLPLVGLSDPEPLPSPSSELASVQGGAAWDVDVEGDTAFLVAGYHLLILDVSDPAEPQFIAQSPVLPAQAWAVDVVDGFAYLAVGGDVWLRDDKPFERGLFVVDVRDVASPSVVGSLEMAGGARDVVVAHNTAYVGIDSHIVVVDVSQPERPKHIKMLRNMVSDPKSGSLATAGSYLYTSTGAIIDISRPSSPQPVVDLNVAGTVAVHDQVAYFMGYDYSLSAYDVRVPLMPRLLNRLDLGEIVTCPSGDQPVGVALAADDANLIVCGGCDSRRGAGESDSFIVHIDVRDASDPRLVSSVFMPTLGVAAARAGEHVFVASLGISFYAFDQLLGLSSLVAVPGVAELIAYGPLGPSVVEPAAIVGTWSALQSLGGSLVFEQELAYAIDAEAAGLAVYDASNPERLVRIGLAPTDEEDGLILDYGPDAVSMPRPIVSNGQVWVRTTSGLLHFDATDPAAPMKTGLVADTIEEESLNIDPVVSDDVLFWVEDSRIIARDASRPSELPAIGASTASIDLSRGALVIEGDLLFLSDDRSISIWNVSDPTEITPIATGEKTIPRTGIDVVASTAPVLIGNHLFDLDFDPDGRGLTVWDLSIPESPEQVASIRLEDLGLPDLPEAKHMMQRDGRLYITNGPSVFEFDVSDPVRPVVRAPSSPLSPVLNEHVGQGEEAKFPHVIVLDAHVVTSLQGLTLVYRSPTR